MWLANWLINYLANESTSSCTVVFCRGIKTATTSWELARSNIQIATLSIHILTIWAFRMRICSCNVVFCRGINQGVLGIPGRNPQNKSYTFLFSYMLSCQNPLAGPMDFGMAPKTAQSTHCCFRASRYPKWPFRVDGLQKSNARHRCSQTPLNTY